MNDNADSLPPTKSAVSDAESKEATTTEATTTSSPSSSPAPSSAHPVRGHWFSPWLVVAVLALGLAGWQWYETRARLVDTQQELAKRLSESDAVANESRALAKQAQEQLASVHAKLGELEGRLADSKSQQEVLESLYQNLARNSEESALAEIEHSVTLASQQLQLAGNVQGAVLALQAAEARIAASNRPQFIGLRKVLVRDLERLRAVPELDLPGMYLRIENVITSIDTLPLAVDGRPREDGAPGPAEADAQPTFSIGYWKVLGLDLWREVRSLVRIQRFDREEPALLTPSQIFFLRENIKLRLLTARLALLSRDQWTYRNELKQCLASIGRYFDGQAPAVRRAMEVLGQLSATELNIALPSLNDSLSAIKTARSEKERP